MPLSFKEMRFGKEEWFYNSNETNWKTVVFCDTVLAYIVDEQTILLDKFLVDFVFERDEKHDATEALTVVMRFQDMEFSRTGPFHIKEGQAEGFFTIAFSPDPYRWKPDGSRDLNIELRKGEKTLLMGKVKVKLHQETK